MDVDCVGDDVRCRQKSAAVTKLLDDWCRPAGAGLLKLAIDDMGNTGTVARIVSFIGVGVLLLVIGYLAPMPPNAPKEEREKAEAEAAGQSDASKNAA